MFFMTVREFVRDVRTIGAKPGTPQVGRLGGESEDRKGAWVRIAMQIALTLVVLALCGWVVFNPGATDGAVKLANLGFGAIIGYWLR
jgi:hypothetical protein